MGLSWLNDIDKDIHIIAKTSGNIAPNELLQVSGQAWAEVVTRKTTIIVAPHSSPAQICFQTTAEILQTLSMFGLCTRKRVTFWVTIGDTVITKICISWC